MYCLNLRHISGIDFTSTWLLSNKHVLKQNEHCGGLAQFINDETMLFILNDSHLPMKITEKIIEVFSLMYTVHKPIGTDQLVGHIVVNFLLFVTLSPYLVPGLLIYSPQLIYKYCTEPPSIDHPVFTFNLSLLEHCNNTNIIKYIYEHKIMHYRIPEKTLSHIKLMMQN